MPHPCALCSAAWLCCAATARRFDATELELLLCGFPTIDMEDWRQNVECVPGHTCVGVGVPVVGLVGCCWVAIFARMQGLGVLLMRGCWGVGWVGTALATTRHTPPFNTSGASSRKW